MITKSWRLLLLSEAANFRSSYVGEHQASFQYSYMGFGSHGETDPYPPGPTEENLEIFSTFSCV